MSPKPRESLLLGRTRWNAPALLLAGVEKTLDLARGAWPRGVWRRRWIRYETELAQVPPGPPGVHLVRVTGALVESLGARPERVEPELHAGLRLWEGGVREAYAWIDEHGPLAIQWVVTARDRARLGALADEAALALPLRPDWGELVHPFVFAAARVPAIAVAFQAALFDELRRSGLAGLGTHVLEERRVARAFLTGTGWRQAGTITRYLVGWPPRLAARVYVQRSREGLGDRVSATDSEQLVRSRTERAWDPSTPSPVPGTPGS